MAKDYHKDSRVVTMRVPLDTYHLWDREAKAQHVSVANLVRDAMDQMLEKPKPIKRTVRVAR